MSREKLTSFERDTLILAAFDCGDLVVTGSDVIRCYVDRWNHKFRIQKKPRFNHNGYLYMSLWGLGIGRCGVAVHRLVWLWNYDIPVPIAHTIHHCDCDKTNNHIDNLEALDESYHGSLSMSGLPEF